MMWLAIFLCSLAIIFLFGLLILHRIEHRNGDRWDDQQ